MWRFGVVDSYWVVYMLCHRVNNHCCSLVVTISRILMYENIETLCAWTSDLSAA